MSGAAEEAGWAQSRESARMLAALVGISAAAAAIRLYRLGEKSLWIDEAASVAIARLGWTDFWRALWDYEGNMAFYYLLLRGWLLVGDGEAALRGLSVIAAVAAVPALYLLGRDLFGRREGLMAAALLSVNVFHIRYSQEARSYSLTVLLVVLSLWFFVQSIRAPSPRNRAAHIMLSALAVYSHLFAALILAAQLCSLLACGSRGSRRSLLSSFAASGLLLIPAAAFVLSRGGGQIDWVGRPGARALYDLFLRFAGHSRLLLAAYLACALMAIGLALRSGARRSPDAHPPAGLWPDGAVLIWLTVPMLVAMAFSLVKPIYYPRFLIVCLPALLLLVARAVAGSPSVWPHARWPGRALLLLMVALSIRGALSYYRGFGSEGNAWRSVTGYIQNESHPGDAILFYRPQGRLAFEYYLAGDRSGPAAAAGPAIVYPPEGEPAIHRYFHAIPARENLKSAMGGYSRIWLVLHHAWDPGTNHPRDETLLFQSAIEERLRVHEEKTFPGSGAGRITVRLYGR